METLEQTRPNRFDPITGQPIEPDNQFQYDHTRNEADPNWKDHDPAWDANSPEKAKADREAAQAKFKIINDARYELIENNFLYPFSKLEVGQGFFVPLEDGNTIDKLYTATSKQVNAFRLENSEIEKNDEGDEVLENFTIRSRLRNPDGSFKLDGEGVPKLSVSSGLRPKLIGPTFAVRAMVKDDEIAENTKAESNGVLVIRLG